MNMNVIGPLEYKREHDNEWDEIICNKQILYYYFKKGTYYSFSDEYDKEKGCEWYQIGNKNYMVVIGDINYQILNEDNNFSKVITEICSDAKEEGFDVNIPIDFDIIKSFKEVFEILIQSPKELFKLIKYIIDKINLKIITNKLEKDKIATEFTQLLDVFKFINYENRFQISSIIRTVVYIFSITCGSRNCRVNLISAI